MVAGIEAYFDDANELRAYEAFCAAQERDGAGFQLGEPALVCRWRMAGTQVPLLNRHIRALSQRSVHGEPLRHNLVSWAKQHIEWSLAEGAYPERDGVLMLVVDAGGNAAMTVGAYEPLEDTALEALAARAVAARTEAASTGVAPEVLGAVSEGRVLLAAEPGEHLCGAASLLVQLAQTRGHEVACALGEGSGGGEAAAAIAGFREAARPDAAWFLISDEHGVVPAAEQVAERAANAELVATLRADIAKLFS